MTAAFAFIDSGRADWLLVGAAVWLLGWALTERRVIRRRR